ncbi:hypothetical protein, partial [Paenibacillus lautus]|uniref:hypothetical protein n=1 Tax=Paenibacillus lautus TaxID=1401 RepID=UPI001C7E0A3A
MHKLIGCKVFGNWGEAGWDYGVIVNEFSDSLGTDIVIEWEDGRRQNVDLKDTTEINEDSDIHTIGIHVDVKGKYLSSSVNTQADKQDKKPTKPYTPPNINNYNTYSDLDKLQVLTSCLVDIIMSLEPRGYGYHSLSLSEQKRAKSVFFEELNKRNILITTSMINKAKSLTWNTIA